MDDMTKALKAHAIAMKDLTRVLATINENVVEIGRMMQKDREPRNGS
jgi:hypothetical protein